jgi:hypothetical protein
MHYLNTNKKNLSPLQVSVSCQITASISVYRRHSAERVEFFLSNTISEVRNVKDVTTGYTKICSFKALGHPTVTNKLCIWATQCNPRTAYDYEKR